LLAKAPTVETQPFADPAFTWLKLVFVSANKPATVLRIDDEQLGLGLRKALLESDGHRVLTATSGAEGIRQFQSEHVDVVVLDYWMAGIRGLDVARELKRLKPGIPIIILSAFISLPDEIIGVADVWLRKAEVEPADLLKEVQRLLKEPRKGIAASGAES